MYLPLLAKCVLITWGLTAATSARAAAFQRKNWGQEQQH